MKYIKKILKDILIIVLVLFTAFSIYSVINLKYLHQDLSNIFGYSILEVVSGSMEPTVHVKDLVLIDANKKDYKVNDIVTYKDDDNVFVTHRIVFMDGNYMITKGDNNESSDKLLNMDRIVGKCVGKVSYLGSIMNAIKQPIALALILIFGSAICILISIKEEI